MISYIIWASKFSLFQYATKHYNLELLTCREFGGSGLDFRYSFQMNILEINLKYTICDD